MPLLPVSNFMACPRISFTGRRLCDGPIPSPDPSYRVCVFVYHFVCSGRTVTLYTYSEYVSRVRLKKNNVRNATGVISRLELQSKKCEWTSSLYVKVCRRPYVFWYLPREGRSQSRPRRIPETYLMLWRGGNLDFLNKRLQHQEQKIRLHAPGNKDIGYTVSKAGSTHACYVITQNTNQWLSSFFPTLPKQFSVMT
jgi:hypothetical protein